MALRQKLLLTAALAVVALASFLPVHFAVDAEFWNRLMDAGHLPMFGLLALVFHFIHPAKRPGSLVHCATSVSLSTLVAATAELLQPLVGRTESWFDLRNGVFGAMIAVSGAALSQQRAKKRWRQAHALAALAIAAFALWPAFSEWRGICWRHANFPLLGEFESEAELRLWTAQGGSERSATSIRFTPEQAVQGKNSLAIHTGAGSWAGVSYSAGDKDWSGFKQLAFDVFDPGEPFVLSVRVDDDGDCSKFGSRYDNGFPLEKGWNHLAISLRELEHGPRSRKLNLRAIRRLALFTGANEPARSFFLDHVRLE